MIRGGVREALGWVSAAAIGVIVAAQVAQTARAEMLFRDGDSLIVALMVQSVFRGEPFDWVMSSVLFIPESLLFAASSVLPLGSNGLLAVNAVLNVIALYGAIRLVAGRRRVGAAPVAWSLTALGTFGIIAMTETSASRSSFELASLLLTTTYYSATVIGVIATIGILRRALDRPTPGRLLPFWLAVTAAVSTLSNPLYGAWATAPLGALLALRAIRAPARTPTRRAALVLMMVLGGGSLAGLALRIPLDPWIAKSGASYVQPLAWLDSLGYYGGFALSRLQTPGGVVAGMLLLGLFAFAVVRSARLRDPASRLVATSAWVLPVIVVVGGIALGTHATRYLQPALFAPLLALVAAPRALPVPAPRWVIATASVALLGVSAVSVPRLAASATQPDADLVCVTDWVEESGATGGGQFWTVRLPKLHVDDPARLVQVHSNLDAYGWLVNRTDYVGVDEVEFLVESDADGGWILPPAASPDEVILCGRYRILDFRTDPLPIGPLRL